MIIIQVLASMWRKMETSNITGGNVKLYSYFGKQFGSPFQKVKYKYIIYPQKFHLGMYPTEMKIYAH